MREYLAQFVKKLKSNLNSFTRKGRDILYSLKWSNPNLNLNMAY